MKRKRRSLDAIATQEVCDGGAWRERVAVLVGPVRHHQRAVSVPTNEGAMVGSLDLVFVPWDDGDVTRHVVLGAQWLRRQSGRKAVFVPGKRNYQYNAALPRLTAGAVVLTPRTLHRAQWSGGPLLACWPTEQMLGTISDRLGGRVTSVCVLEWGDAPFQRAWITAHGGIDLTTGQRASNGGVHLPPVVLVAMEHLSSMVNHANGLVSSFDKGIAVDTLQALVRRGHRFDVDDLCAWALANGFTASEVDRLRDYATKALAGHRFRGSGHGRLRADILQMWEAETRDR